METIKVSDGNGGHANVVPDTAVIIKHLDFMKQDIRETNEKIKIIFTEVGDIKDSITLTEKNLISVQKDTDENTLMRHWVYRTLIVAALAGGSGAILFKAIGALIARVGVGQ